MSDACKKCGGSNMRPGKMFWVCEVCNPSVPGILGHEKDCQCAICEDLAPMLKRLTRLEAVLSAARKVCLGDFVHAELSEAIRAADEKGGG